MELDWTTFALEIVNFLVLLWLLSRFLYRPVANAISTRRAMVEHGLQEARDARDQAAALQAQAQARLSAWEEEKAAAYAALEQSLATERNRRLEALQVEIAQGRSRAEALAQRDAAERERQAARRALDQAAAFCSRLLAPLAGPELEARIVELAGAELERLPQERRDALRGNGVGAARIASAYALAASQHAGIERALRTLVGRDIDCVFEEDRSLMAGLRVRMGAWIFGANLRDELAAFAEAGDGRD